MKKTAFALLLLITSFSAMAQDETRQSRRARPVAKNIFGVDLVHVTEDNVGFSLSLEHFLGDNGTFSLYLPVSYSVSQNKDNNGYYDDYVYYGYSPYNIPLSGSSDRNKGMFYFYPGVKVYPGGAFKKVSYAVGCNLAAGFGSMEKTTSFFRLDSVVNQGVANYSRVKTSEITESLSRVKIGAMFSNSLNIRPSNQLYMGIEFGIGYCYLNKIGSDNRGTDVLVQAGFKLGFVK